MTSNLRAGRSRRSADHGTRRDFLRLALGGSACLGFGAAAGSCKKKSSRAEAGKQAQDRPRYFVGLLMSGGHDTMYTTDPKERSEVLDNVDLPENNEITSAGNLRLGVHFAPLAPIAPDLATVNGVQLGTANHDTGIMQFFRLKTNASVHMPSALDIVGAHRDQNQPLGAIYLNVLFRMNHTPKYIGTADRFYHGKRNLLEEIAATSPDELRTLSKTLAAEAHSLRREGQRTSTSVTLDNLEQTARFFAKVADVEPQPRESYSGNYLVQVMAEAFDNALWLLKNDLTCGVGLDLGLMEWDTHIANHKRQTGVNTAFVKHFSRFMASLAETSNEYGTLADQTVIFAGSDMGRFPRLNDMKGKDHLPQTSFMFAGPGIASGATFGATGKNMEARPISMSTGAENDTGRVLLLDDIGNTMLTMAGLDPELYGYQGEVMDFLSRKRAG